MLSKSECIIFGSQSYGEADLLVHFFSKQDGIQYGIAKSAKKSKRRFVNCLCTFHVSELEYDIKNLSELCFIRSGRLKEYFSGIYSDYKKMVLASHFLDIVKAFSPPSLVDQKVFDLLRFSLRYLSKEVEPFKIYLYFSLNAISLGGYGIRIDRCINCNRIYRGKGKAVFIPSKGGISCLRCQKGREGHGLMLSPESINLMYYLQRQESDLIKKVDITHKAISEIRRVIQAHLRWHFGNQIKTFRYLDALPFE